MNVFGLALGFFFLFVGVGVVFESSELLLGLQEV